MAGAAQEAPAEGFCHSWCGENGVQANKVWGPVSIEYGRTRRRWEARGFDPSGSTLDACEVPWP